jgi:aromatic-L-amino-acid decarboxylase
MANFAALATALRASTDIDVMRLGVRALGTEPRIYVSAMAHVSMPKAAGLLGLGRASAHVLPVDDQFRMDVAALDTALTEDRKAGRLPICVVGTAGDVNTGAIDPLDAIADICARHKVWFHVDAAYGGFAALAPSVRSRFRGVARADSVALDPHKWLFAPLDAGCLLVRDPAALGRTFSASADYMNVVADSGMSDFAFWDYGPELSRRFRALKLWFALKVHGADAVAAAIEHNIALAGTLAASIDASDDFERLAPVPLSIVCFRYVPANLRKGAADEATRNARLDEVNRQLLIAIQRDGDAYLSNATIGGDFALRACLINHRTTEGDTTQLLATIRRLARGLW